MKLTLYDFLRIGHIKRWHNVNTVRSQTVAEHSFMVTLIAIDLYDSLVGAGGDGDGDGNWRELAILMFGALFHDAPEAAGGDTPTPAKRLIRELTGDPLIFDKLDAYLMPKLPYIGNSCDGVPPALEEFIKMADAIEGYHWIHDNGAGTHAEVVKMAARRRLEDLVHKFDTAGVGAGDRWYGAVNRVLMAMNLPYVHKESRLSPP